ncbi:MAG: YaaR family protein [Fervidobacterium sp.]|nr:YaaR family protein [Fervidobacterium sp.]
MRIEPPVNDPKLKSSEVKRKKAGKKDGVRSSSSSSFVGMFEEAEEEAIRKTIEEMVTEVVEAGNDFVRSPTPNTLKKYKSHIKQVLEYIEKHLYKLSGKYDYDLSQPRLHIIAEEIDEKLDNIASLLLQAERDTLVMAEKVGEINGIIFDIYR